MIKNLCYLLLAFSLFSCSKDNSLRNNNPYLPDISFNLPLALDFPKYNNLNFPGNSYVDYNYGIKGIVVYNVNNSQYAAFELSDPNHPLEECSKLTVHGVIATCNCDDSNKYNILTGEITSGTGQYALKRYRVVKNGNVLLISN